MISNDTCNRDKEKQKWKENQIDCQPSFPQT